MFSMFRTPFGDPSSEMDAFVDINPSAGGVKAKEINVIVAPSGRGKSVFSQRATVELNSGEVGEMIGTPNRMVVKIGDERREIQATDIKRVLHD